MSRDKNEFCNNVLEHILCNDNNAVEIGSPKLKRNRVFFLPSRNAVLKIFNRENKFKNELLSLQLLNRNELPFIVPKILDYRYNQLWILTDVIEGKQLILEDTKSKKIEEFAYIMGRMQAALHERFRSDVCGQLVNLAPETYYPEYISNIFNLEDKTINSHPLLYHAKVKALSIIKELNVKQYVLCHNDFNFRNIIVKNKIYEKIGLIDFESADFKQREADLVSMYIHCYPNKKIWKLYFQGYIRECGMSLNTECIIAYIILRCIEICTWAYSKDKKYYNKARQIIEYLAIEKGDI